MERETVRTKELRTALDAFPDVDLDVLRDAADRMSAAQSEIFESEIAWDEEAVTRDSLVMTAKDFGLTPSELQKYVHRAQSTRLVKSASADLDLLTEQFTKWITGTYLTLEDATQAYREHISSPVGEIEIKTEKWRDNMYIGAEWQNEQLFTIHAKIKSPSLYAFRMWLRRLFGKTALDPELQITVIGPRGASLTVRQFHEQYRRSADDEASDRDRAFRSAREDLYAAVDHDVVRGLASSVGLDLERP